jgi:Bacterial Ig-like domain (group 2)
MRKTRRASTVVVWLGIVSPSLLLMSCGGGSSSSGTGGGSQAVLSSISLSPTPVNLSAGQTQQLTATAKYSDGSTKDVSSSATWSSSTASVATVSVSGLVTSVAAGQVTIFAALSGVSGSEAVTVNPKALSSIAVSPSTANFPIGESRQYSASGTYTDGSAADLTSTVTWSSSAPAVAAVSTGGLVSGLATGTTTISASISGVTGTTGLTVSMLIPTSWTPMGVDYGLKKQCIRTTSPTQANFYYDDADCPGSSYPASGYWTTAVEAENSAGICYGTVDQSYLVNGTGSPVTETWAGDASSGYSVDLKTDYTNIANPCAPNNWTWVPLMDNRVGGGPLPAPSQLVVEFNATYNRNLPAGSGATRAFAGVGAQWDIAGSNGQPVLSTFSVEINFYTDEPQWGKQRNLPPDVIGVINGGAFNYYVALDGTKLFAPVFASLGTSTQITANWAAVLQHVIDEGLFPAPVNGWNNSNAVTTGTFIGTEVMNSVNGTSGPMADLVVSGYKEGSFTAP